MAKHRSSPKRQRAAQPSGASQAGRAPQPSRATKHAPGVRAPGVRARARADRWLIALVCLAAVLRLWGIQDRLPDPSLGINVLEDTAIEETDRTTMGRAWTLWRGGVIPLDLNPHTGGWPALSFYTTLATQWVGKMIYWVNHPGTTAAQFESHVASGVGARDIFILARLLGAAIGVLTVVLTYRLGWLLAGRFVGIGAGLLLAANLPHILVSQHVSDPNLLALLFVLLACFPIVRIARGQGTTRDSVVAGAMIGLAGACKYVPLVLGLPFLFAHRRGVRDRAFWLGAAATAVALFIATPFTFLDWETTLRDLTRQRASLFSNWVGQSEFPISLPTYLITTIPHAIGWPAYLLSIAGCVLLWRRGRAERVLVGMAVVMIVVNGMLKAAQERYVLVAIPILGLAAAAAFERAIAWWRARRLASTTPGEETRLERPATAVAAVAAIAAALTVGWPLPELAQIRSTLSKPDTRHISRRWIQANLPPSAPTVIELYGPVFAEPERLFTISPFFATQAPLVRPAFHPEFLDGVRFIVLSSGISSRFERDSANYPVEVAYYRWLRQHAPLLWSTAQEKASGPTIEVRSLPPAISTRARRDSLFAAFMPRPNRTTRLALYCADLSTMFGKLNQADRAEEWARRGLRVDARNMNGQLQITLAMALLEKHDAAGAERAAAAGVALLPRSASAHLYRGLALRQMGRAEEAVPELRVAFSLSGDNRVRMNLAQLYAELGQYERAAEQFDAVPPEAPDRGLARRDLGVIYINKLNRVAEGVAALQEAALLERDPKEQALLRAEIERITAAASRARP